MSEFKNFIVVGKNCAHHEVQMDLSSHLSNLFSEFNRNLGEDDNEDEARLLFISQSDNLNDVILCENNNGQFSIVNWKLNGIKKLDLDNFIKKMTSKNKTNFTIRTTNNKVSESDELTLMEQAFEPDLFSFANKIIKLDSRLVRGSINNQNMYLIIDAT
ncbi:MAG: hypothetical protein JNM93_00220 [Bacteriovoracaceae bacterium]|nr:hypothetical protein [Bacteriovoracaceae bacterium]